MNGKYNKKRVLFFVILFILIGVVIYFFLKFGFKPSIKSDESLSKIKLPEGFRIEVYADNLGGSLVSNPGPNVGPRMMLLKNNVLFVSLTAQGKVVALPDKNNDKKADKTITFIDNLKSPHGIDFSDGWFYIAEEDKIIRVRDDNNDLTADKNSTQVLVGLPAGGHFTRTIRIHNNSFFISIGSSCNVCNEEDERRASILRCDVDGKNCKVFVKGLRNAVSFVFNPADGKMYATENGRDLLGDDIPPDEINIVEEGKNYGWPICYGKNIHDTEFDKNVYIRNPCSEPFESSSFVDLKAHSAPLGLAFYYGNNFPEEYKGNLFVAFHGSWNRQQPTGYKIVRIKMKNLEVSDFAVGWLQGSNVIGRPVDIIVADDGSLLVSDDNAGKIYRIHYER